MSMWMDEPSADGFEDNPLAAGLAPEDDLLAAQGEGESWDPSQGYPDSTLSVRIWVDEDKRLTDVQISNRWRERARGTSLSSMFDEAFLLANASIGGGAPPDVWGEDPAETGSDLLTWESLAAIQEQTQEVVEEAAKLDANPDSVTPARWEGKPAEGYSRNRKVQVRLTVHGQTEKVTFDEQWLSESRVSQVRDAVREAHEDAYAAFVAPVFVPGDRERLACQLNLLHHRASALISRGSELQEGSL